MSKIPNLKKAQKVSQIASIGSKSIMQIAPTVSQAFVNMAEAAQDLKKDQKQ